MKQESAFTGVTGQALVSLALLTVKGTDLGGTLIGMTEQKKNARLIERCWSRPVSETEETGESSRDSRVFTIARMA